MLETNMSKNRMQNTYTTLHVFTTILVAKVFACQLPDPAGSEQHASPRDAQLVVHRMKRV